MAKRVYHTKLPKIVKLPSGSYHAKVFSHIDENGKRIYQSFTNPDYDALVLELAQFKIEKKNERIALKAKKEEKSTMTVGQMLDNYISSKESILSPATIREYKRMRNKNFPGIINKNVDDLTQIDIQREINESSKTRSPKTLRNMHGLLSAALSVYRPDFKLLTTLPKKVKPDIQIPSEAEMKRVFEHVRDSEMEIPIYLAACCGLRRSEISALSWSHVDLKKRTITVTEALVRNEDDEYVPKKTKSPAGKRIIRMFPFVYDVLAKQPQKSGSVTNLLPYQIYDRWVKIIRETGIRHYRFHDLRHYTVSVMLALNIPKNYIADYMGHETEDMIDNVYGHIMKEHKTSFEDKLQTYFTSLISDKCETKSETK